MFSDSKFRFIRIFLLLCLISLPIRAVQAECLVSGDGPRIGLALSGGGARGAAHIGVLKVLESLQIPVHCIAGTSMGSVVGALYAAGFPAPALQQTLENLDWNRAFADKFPRSDLSFHRKVEEDSFLINFELGFSGWSVSMPRGVIQGHSLHLLLKELFGGASLITDFNDLPIPFRSIATDIVTSEAVVLDRGDIARAVQASMAIPGVFAPLEIDGRLLVDGGVSRNLPVIELMNMGADIIIAVDVGTPLYRRERLNSVVSVVDQLTNVLIQNNTVAQIGLLDLERDILITPDLDGYTSLSFANATGAVVVGEQAARAQQQRLAALSLPAVDYRRYQDGLEELPQLPESIADLLLVQRSRLPSGVLKRRLLANANSAEKPFDLQTFHAQLDKLYSIGLYEQVGYGFEADEHGYRIEVDAVDKTWGPDLIRFGFSLQDDLKGNNQFTISAGYLRKAINAYGADIRAVVTVGERLQALVDFFQPLGPLSDNYVQTLLSHEQFSSGRLTDDGINDARIRRSELGLFIGRQFIHRADLQAGVSLARGAVSEDEGLEQNFDNYHEASLLFRFRYDTLDSIRFPSSGGRFEFAYEHSVPALGADNEYGMVRLNATRAQQFGQTRLVSQAEVNGVTRDELPLQKQFGYIGPLNFAAQQEDEVVGQYAGTIGAALYRPWAGKQFNALEFPVYYGASVALTGVFQHRDQINIDNTLLTGSLFLGADTPLGPAILGLGMLEEHGLNALLSLGVTF